MSEAGLPRRRTARRGAVLAAGLVLSSVALAFPFDCSFHLQLGQVGTMTVAG